MQLFKSVAEWPVTQKVIGTAAAEYLRLVWKTSRFVLEPADAIERIANDAPIILTMWHGQHFLTPFIKPSNHTAKVLISRHRDGEINAIAAERLGIGTIRGSGDPSGGASQKGGAKGFMRLLRTLQGGDHVALTADIPKVARVAGLGVVTLAKFSGRPIYPIAMATHWRKELSNWDRSTINYPFGRGAGIVGAPIRVASGADDNELEQARAAVEQALNAATTRAYALAARR